MKSIYVIDVIVTINRDGNAYTAVLIVIDSKTYATASSIGCIVLNGQTTYAYQSYDKAKVYIGKELSVGGYNLGLWKWGVRTDLTDLDEQTRASMEKLVNLHALIYKHMEYYDES